MERASDRELPSGTLYTTLTYGALLANGGLTDVFYIDWKFPTTT